MTTHKLERILIVDTSEINANMIKTGLKKLSHFKFSWAGTYKSAYDILKMNANSTLEIERYVAVLIAETLDDNHSGGILAGEIGFLRHCHKIPKIIYSNIIKNKQQGKHDERTMPEFIEQANILRLRQEPTAKQLFEALQNPEKYVEDYLKNRAVY